MSDLTGGGIANRPKSSLLRLRSSGLSIDSYDAKNEIRVLVLYSGGTIGMRSHNGGMKSMCMYTFYVAYNIRQLICDSDFAPPSH